MPYKGKILNKAIEYMYDASCLITGVQSGPNEFGQDVSKEVTLYENVRCHVSAVSAKSAEDMQVVRTDSPVKKIFLDASLDVPVGSSFIVTSDSGNATNYVDSGKSTKYVCHQEIIVKES